MNQNELDADQQAILYVYSKYSSEKNTQYLQYTAALVLFYYLMSKGIFPAYKEQLLVYDYKDSRRYMWEDKKFMADINIVRDVDFLNRARLKTENYRDLNAHYCTTLGHRFIELNYQKSKTASAIDALLKCRCGHYRQVVLHDDCPELVCKKCKQKPIKVEGFLYDLSEPIRYPHTKAFI